MNQIPVLNFQEYISADGDTLLTDSRKVAFVFGKRHKDVLKAIRARLEEAGDWGLRNFAHTPYVDEQNGQTYPAYAMTKNGFVFLVQKFSGKRAVAFQIAYIEAFDAMAKLQHNIRYGLMFECNKKHLEYKGKKWKASEYGRGLNEWKHEKPVLPTELDALQHKLQPQLPFPPTLIQ